MKRLLSMVLLFVVAFSFTACGNSEKSAVDKKGTVGIAMPSKSLERWERDGSNMVKEFKGLGYDTDIQYAEDDVQTQVSQIENMITKGVDMLVIAAIDGEALTEVIEKAHSQDIPVIAYDRLIMNTEYVDYYVTFDNFSVGTIQAQYIVDKLGLEDGKGPFNIEVFAGAPDDNNAKFFYNGAMSILQPYIDSGKLVVKSGQIEFNKIATENWDGAKAQARMDNLLSANYADEEVQAVLAPNDAVARGVASSLKSIGYGTDSRAMPIITGQDAELASVKSIIAGEQTQTVFKDTRALAEKAISMADALLSDKEVEVNDKETYDNGKKVVPTYLLDPVSVDVNNYKKVLVDSNYYTENDLK